MIIPKQNFTIYGQAYVKQQTKVSVCGCLHNSNSLDRQKMLSVDFIFINTGKMKVTF